MYILLIYARARAHTHTHTHTHTHIYIYIYTEDWLLNINVDKQVRYSFGHIGVCHSNSIHAALSFYTHTIFGYKTSHLLKKSDARCRCGGRLSKLSVSTGPCIRVVLISNFWEAASSVGTFARGVLGVLTPTDGVLDDGTRRGDGVPDIRSFW